MKLIFFVAFLTFFLILYEIKKSLQVDEYRWGEAICGEHTKRTHTRRHTRAFIIAKYSGRSNLPFEYVVGVADGNY